MDIEGSKSEVNGKNGSGRCSGFVVVTVIGVSSPVNILEDGSATGYERRSYGDMLKEERAIELLRDG